MYTRNCEIKEGRQMPDGMQRIALGIEYMGANFHGFQRQKSASNTIQAKVDAALSAVADEDITTVCAGRTDARVHASLQVLHFDTLAQRGERAWVMGTNSKLPHDIRVLWARAVSANFHARFSATCRTYRYVMLHSAQRPALLHQAVTWLEHEVDIGRMGVASQSLVGEQDFSAFRAAQCQSQSPNREVRAVSIYRDGAFIVLEICANAFLYHMVRNIAGSLIAIGQGKQDTSWIAQLIKAKDRSAAAPTAHPQGLYLVDIHYPDEFALPSTVRGPVFLKP